MMNIWWGESTSRVSQSHLLKGKWKSSVIQLQQHPPPQSQPRADVCKPDDVWIMTTATPVTKWYYSLGMSFKQSDEARMNGRKAYWVTASVMKELSDWMVATITAIITSILNNYNQQHRQMFAFLMSMKQWPRLQGWQCQAEWWSTHECKREPMEWLYVTRWWTKD